MTWKLRILAALCFTAALVCASFLACCSDASNHESDGPSGPPQRGGTAVMFVTAPTPQPSPDAMPDATVPPQSSPDMGKPVDPPKPTACDVNVTATPCPEAGHARCVLDSRYVAGCRIVNSTTDCVQSCGPT